ncbi:cytochrome P450 [Saccharopolyspora sp. ASAGF58]|uniref:cytochrome P450 n=1 Tax=Saccharopolyspora sp. ASAGF58 TaxID=2719023 RepID=UPI00143FBBAE|nr:cytochrome P450 [Saccharopolyspora sp. ASAGF58]QIZ36544.1 cytochrome P450 [Saccharopolyspora sp. ASAGF58]
MPKSVDFDPFSTHREDPYPYLLSAQETRPVFYSDRLEAWCVTRHSDIERALRDSALFSCRDHNPRPPKTLSPDLLHALETWRGNAPPMGSIDGPEHARIRAVAGRGFTARILNSYEPQIIRVADSLIERMSSRSTFSFISEFAYPFPLSVILSVLGVPEEYHDSCREWTELRISVLLPRETPPAEVQQRCLKGLRDFVAMSRSIVADRLKHPREDLISYMLHSDIRGNRMTADEVVAQIPTFISAGHESTAQALASITYRLLTTPAGWRELAEGSVKSPALVEEGLRFDGPISGFFRTAKADCEIAGTPIPKGSRIFLAFGAGSRDKEVFPEANKFLTERSNARSHLAFGGGPHHCVGAALARLELSIALDRLAHNFPNLRLVSGQSTHHLPRFPLRALSDFLVSTDAELP